VKLITALKVPFLRCCGIKYGRIQSLFSFSNSAILICLFNPLKPEICLNNRNFFPASLHFWCKDHLRMFWEIVFVYTKSHMKHRNTCCGWRFGMSEQVVLITLNRNKNDHQLVAGV
jgi:hypothetical protein